MDSKKQYRRAAFADSSWVRHAAIVALALVGTAISAYLCAYQYGLLANVWDPIFGVGSAQVLNYDFFADLSRHLGLAVHDALLGASAYVLEILLALAITRRPSATFLLGGYTALVSLMALTGLSLVLLQGAVVGSWCLLCLISAGISALVFGLSYPEVAFSFAAMLARLQRTWRRKHSHHIRGHE